MDSKRNHERVRSPKILVRIPSLDKLRTHYLKDLSEGGLFVKTDKLLPVGTSVDLELAVPNSPLPLQLKAKVVRHAEGEVAAKDGGAGMGLKFEAVDTQSEELLSALMAECRRPSLDPLADKLRMQNQSLVFELSAARESSTEKDREITSLQERLKHALEEVAAADQRAQKFKEELEQIEDGDAATRALAERLANEKAALTKRLKEGGENVAAEANALRAELAQVREEQAAAAQQLADERARHEAELQQRDAALQQYEAERQQLDALQQQHQAELQQRDAALQQYEAERQQLEANQQQHQAEIQQRDAALQQLEAERQRLEALLQEQAAVQQEREATADQHRALQEQHAATIEAIDALRQDSDGAKEALAALQQERAELQEALNSLQAEHQALQARVDEGHQAAQVSAQVSAQATAALHNEKEARRDAEARLQQQVQGLDETRAKLARATEELQLAQSRCQRLERDLGEQAQLTERYKTREREARKLLSLVSAKDDASGAGEPPAESPPPAPRQAVPRAEAPQAAAARRDSPDDVQGAGFEVSLEVAPPAESQPMAVEPAPAVAPSHAANVDVESEEISLDEAPAATTDDAFEELAAEMTSEGTGRTTRPPPPPPRAMTEEELGDLPEPTFDETPLDDAPEATSPAASPPEPLDLEFDESPSHLQAANSNLDISIHAPRVAAESRKKLAFPDFERRLHAGDRIHRTEKFNLHTPTDPLEMVVSGFLERVDSIDALKKLVHGRVTDDRLAQILYAFYNRALVEVKAA